MRVLVCGGRDFSDSDFLHETLREIPMITGIIHGDAYGADRLADDWARAMGIPAHPEPVTDALYQKYGRYKAPKIRNQRMLDLHKPDVVVAFPGGGGTADMVRRAEKAGVPVIDKRTDDMNPKHGEAG